MVANLKAILRKALADEKKKRAQVEAARGAVTLAPSATVLSKVLDLHLTAAVNDHRKLTLTMASKRHVRNVVRLMLMSYRGKLACRTTVARALLLRQSAPADGPPVIVTVVRRAPRLLDRDNALGACKSVFDEVAAWMGVDDGAAERKGWVSWIGKQEQAKESSVVVTIADRTSDTPGPAIVTSPRRRSAKAGSTSSKAPRKTPPSSNAHAPPPAERGSGIKT